MDRPALNVRKPVKIQCIFYSTYFIFNIKICNSTEINAVNAALQPPPPPGGDDGDDDGDGDGDDDVIDDGDDDDSGKDKPTKKRNRKAIVSKSDGGDSKSDGDSMMSSIYNDAGLKPKKVKALKNRVQNGSQQMPQDAFYTPLAVFEAIRIMIHQYFEFSNILYDPACGKEAAKEAFPMHKRLSRAKWRRHQKVWTSSSPK